MATTSHPMLTTQSPAHFGPGHYDREEPLPDGWRSAVDPASGKTFYYNEASGVSKWERPAQAATTSHPMLTTQSPAQPGPGHYDREATEGKANKVEEVFMSQGHRHTPSVFQKAARIPKWLAQAASSAGAAETEARDDPNLVAMLQLAAETRGARAQPDAPDDWPGRDWVDEMMRRLDPVGS